MDPSSHKSSILSVIRARIWAWRQRYVGERAFVFILSAIVGVGTGIMAWALKGAIAIISIWVTEGVKYASPDWWLISVPATGVLIVVALRSKWFKGNISYGVSVVKQKLAEKNPFLPAKITYSPITSAAITLGFGGSAGSEGPIAFSGAALGSLAARRFHLSRPMALIMLGCGAGAGIAAIFKAPIGGALFTLEVLRMGLSTFGIMVLFVTTLVAALTATALQGFSLDMVMEQVTEYDPHVLPWALALGVFCGIYSVYYSYIMEWVKGVLLKIKNKWVRGVLSGLGVGVVLFFFPALYGEGYGVMHHVINNEFDAITFGSWPAAGKEALPLTVFYTAASILLLKCFVTSLSYNGGGVTGEFAPTLFAGCFAGYVFGAGCTLIFGIDLSVSQMAFFGMAGVMAGAIRAPLMSIFLVAEMSSAFTLLLPLAITAGVSFGVVRLIDLLGGKR